MALSKRRLPRIKRRKRLTRRVKQRGGNQSNLFNEAYAITLDKYPERFAKMTTFATAAKLDLKPWKGVVITPAEIDTLPPLGVGTTNYKNRHGDVFNLGVIGAFLAHRDLLRSVADKPGGTLIFEDDVQIPPDLYDTLRSLEAEIQEKAPDWDYLFLDKLTTTTLGHPVSEHLIKLDRDMTGYKNWGIWAYIVKNSSIGDRILPTMERMQDVPDIQLATYADKINMYLITPSIVSGDPETALKSVVTNINGSSRDAAA